ncbi:MAG: ABC transporter permease [Candidatus Helarchaeota archaeon]
MVPRWLVLTKSEIRIWTSRFRNHRKLLFSLVILIMGIYSFFLVPFILNFFHLPLHNALMGMGAGLPYFLFFIFSFVCLFIFIWCITYPLSMMLQETTDLSGKLEILISTPIKAQDILFGKYIGRFPTYLIVLFSIAPWLVNIFGVIFPLSVFDQFAIYFVLFILIILGTWLGTLLTAYIESRIRKSEKTRDLGRAMNFVIAILIVILMYSLIWAIISGVNDPSSPLFIILQVFPSSWASFIVMDFFGFHLLLPMNVSFFWMFLLGVTFVSLYLGYHAAGRFYSLEPFQRNRARIQKTNNFYKIFRRLIPGSFGIQFQAHLRQFSRKMENFSRLSYAVVISVMSFVLNYLMGTFEDGLDRGAIVMFLPFMYAWFVAMMLGGWVIIGSKDHLWIYKKAPSGVKKFVWSVYLVNILYSSIIGIIYMTIVSIFIGLSFIDGIIMVGFVFGFVLALMMIGIGIAFIFPTFEERGGKLGIVMMAIAGIIFGGFMLSIFFNELLSSLQWTYSWPILDLLISAILGYCLLRIGIRKLNSLE